MRQKKDIIFSKKQLNTSYIRKRKYGITFQEYNDLFRKQNGQCYICERHQSDLNKSLCVDHCHKTNKIRGLLCNKCNLGISYFDDNPELLRKAIKYLK